MREISETGSMSLSIFAIYMCVFSTHFVSAAKNQHSYPIRVYGEPKEIHSLIRQTVPPPSSLPFSPPLGMFRPYYPQAFRIYSKARWTVDLS